MKKLIFVLFVVLSACAEEKIAPSFDSIEGRWTFSHKEVSGGFEIVDYDGILIVDNGPGNGFEIAGTEYPVLDKAKVIGTIELEIYLVNSNKNNVRFFGVEFNKDYTQLTAKNWVYLKDGAITQINEPIKITR